MCITNYSHFPTPIQGKQDNFPMYECVLRFKNFESTSNECYAFGTSRTSVQRVRAINVEITLITLGIFPLSVLHNMAS
ncbi:hypothetical protein HanXRQr2_Chr03g0128791 [Helianthus annuus]|uniref:Uncharacterized protein n=1 Tax=Helianthus annuus TaxID=4232 RepID=A0A9K3JIM1_HELAN|nr:hypothetical protein HanXRQr2_Chr03g0128791 [Helianthus annuus]